MINVLELGRIMAKKLVKNNFDIGDTEIYFGQNTKRTTSLIAVGDSEKNWQKPKIYLMGY